MSKIFAENSMMGMMKAFWRRCVASGIGFVHNYRYDLYFRTQVAVIGLQVVFTIFVIVLVGGMFTAFYDDILTSIVQGVMQGLQQDTATSTATQLVENLNYLRNRNLIIIGSIVLIGTSIFGYLIAHLTLAPTRNALDAQKQFIGNIAHELRTPLSIIKTHTEVALFSEKLDPETRHMLESTIEELDRTSDIINNLLSLSAFVRPEQMHFGNVDLGSVAESAVKHLSDLAKRKNIEITMEKNSQCIVWGNASALEQVVMNVLKNAVNYTREGGEPVHITMKPGFEGSIELSVQDHGIGIPEKDLYRIFEPFYRGDSSRSRGAGGSGLGLAIVNELLKAHQGRMTIRSAPKRGTTVLISLPRGKIDRDISDDRYGEVAVDFSKNS
ncbi:MAG: HAMP domain-containing sensor histidine kinase [Minisyncoccia bacterium]